MLLISLRIVFSSNANLFEALYSLIVPKAILVFFSDVLLFNEDNFEKVAASSFVNLNLSVKVTKFSFRSLLKIAAVPNDLFNSWLAISKSLEFK